jgi:predicted DNA-binding mobile mystery protein A
VVDRVRAREALEVDLARHRAMPTVAPRTGWIRAVRDALGMSTRELAERIGVSKARINQIERGERERTLTLATLDRVAAGLGCRVEYVLVPELPLPDMVQERARVRAEINVAVVDHTMALEDQRPTRAWVDRRVEEEAERLVDRRGLWS